MVTFPPCKINLGLHVIEKRPDGFHNLETCFYPVQWTDILEIVKADRFGFSSSGNPIPGAIDQNLCIKAYNLLAGDYNLSPVQIHLHKIIPIGSGLGGGSADAAYTIRLLNEIFELRLSAQEMMSYAAQLGSDCAFFIQNSPMIGKGRGELLSEIHLDLRGKFLVLVNPNIHVSTAEAYAGVRPVLPSSGIPDILKRPIIEWRDLLKNDFEASVFEKYPSIMELKNSLYALDAVYASMSGSGATVFGIFDAPIDVTKHFADSTAWAGYIS